MIRPVYFESYEQGEIEEVPFDFPARFAIVKRYPQLFRAYRAERQKIRPFYGHPYTDRIVKPYCGTDREGFDFYSGNNLREPRNASEETLLSRMRNEGIADPALKTEADAETAFGMLRRPEDFEILHVRLAGTDDAYPADWEFLGYDVGYTVLCTGAFSIVGDCLFLPTWHGCDDEGTLFSEDYGRLNENGLFSDWDDAYAYLVKYRNEDWSEMGQFSICEVRHKRADRNE